METTFTASPLGIECSEELAAAELHPDDELRGWTGNGEDIAHDNATRGAHVLGFIAEYARLHDRNEPFESVLIDFLSDVRHAVDMLEEDWEAAFWRSELHYEAELRGEY